MEKTEIKYVKRTQKDYSMSFKLSVVHEFESTDISLGALKRKYGIQGDSTITRWIEKYGNFDVTNKCHRLMDKSKDQKLLNKYHITTSMTESYDPYANAIAERINGILKQEFLLEELNLSLTDMKKVIKDAVKTYNNIRPHYSCAYHTPEFMHSQHHIKIKSFIFA